MRFCFLLGAQPETITEWQLCATAWLYIHSRQVTSLPSFYAGVNRRLKDQRLEELPRGDFFKQHQKGLLDLFGPVDVRAPAPPIDEPDLQPRQRPSHRTSLGDTGDQGRRDHGSRLGHAIALEDRLSGECGERIEDGDGQR